jgi:predicted nucleic acid-binding protein
MIFLLDSSTFSQLMRSHPRATAALAALDPTDRVVISSPVRGEILYGLERLPRGRRRDQLARAARPLFAAIACEPVSEAAADAYAKIKRSQQQRGLSLDENDLWIAATASALGATLVTSDNDFRRIPGLRTVDWTA